MQMTAWRVRACLGRLTPAGRLAVLGVAYFIIYLIGLVFRPSHQLLRLQSDLFYLLVPLAALHLVLRAIVGSHGQARWGCVAFAVLLGAWFLADGSFTFYDLAYSTEPPSPGATDLLYYIGYVGLILGIALTTFPSARIRDGRWLLEAGLVSTLGIVLAGNYLVRPVLADDGYSVVGTAVLLGYPILDVAAFVLLAGAFFAGGSRTNKATLLLMVAGLVLIATDSGYFYLVSVSGYNNVGNPLDLGYIAAYVLFGISFVLPPEGESKASPLTASAVGNALPLSIAAIMVSLLVLESLRGSSTLLLQLGASGTISLVLLGFVISLRRGDGRFAALTRGAGDVISVIDSDTTVLFQSPSIEPLLGYQAEGVVSSKYSELVEPGDRGLFRAFLLQLVSEPEATLVAEVRLRHRDESQRHFELTARDQRSDPAVGGIVLIGRDMTDQRRLEEDLRQQALRDPLTGLLNASAFRGKLAERIAGASGRGMCVFYLDLDNFKAINDGLGHSVGDEILREVGRRLSRATGLNDVVARLGGDEFAAFAQVGSKAEASEKAAEFLKVMEVPIEVGTKRLNVRLSAGVAGNFDGDLPAPVLIDEADAALYAAKRTGKHRVAFFEPAMQEVFRRRLRLMNDLQDSLRQQEFELVYQPIQDLASSRLIALEALARWHHPELGLIMPQEFIPLAEESGFIMELGTWAISKACEDALLMERMVPAGQELAVSVNVSADQLMDPGFANAVASILRATELRPELLVLEITESSMVENLVLCSKTLQQLRELGIRLALDDFGTGYSSLSQLRQLPFDILKIDQAFVQGMDGAASMGEELTSAIVDVGRTLRLEIVAEGIEQPYQLERLRAMGCDAGQGFLISRPLHLDDLQRLFRGESTYAA